MKRTIAAFAVFLGAHSPALAATQYCAGTVLTSWTMADGAVIISSSWRSDHTQICNTKEVWKGITPEVCVNWVAKLDSAVALQRQVTIQYADAPACDALPTYQYSPAPRYVMLR